MFNMWFFCKPKPKHTSILAEERRLIKQQKKLERDEEISRLLKSGISVKEIAIQFNLSSRHIYSIAENQHINNQKHKHNVHIKSEITRLYIDGLSYSKIAIQLDMKRGTVAAMISRMGLSTGKNTSNAEGEMSFAEIGKVLGVTPGRAHVIYNNAIKKINKACDKLGYDYSNMVYITHGSNIEGW